MLLIRRLMVTCKRNDKADASICNFFTIIKTRKLKLSTVPVEPFMGATASPPATTALRSARTAPKREEVWGKRSAR